MLLELNLARCRRTSDPMWRSPSRKTSSGHGSRAACITSEIGGTCSPVGFAAQDVAAPQRQASSCWSVSFMRSADPCSCRTFHVLEARKIGLVVNRGRRGQGLELLRQAHQKLHERPRTCGEFDIICGSPVQGLPGDANAPKHRGPAFGDARGPPSSKAPRDEPEHLPTASAEACDTGLGVEPVRRRR